MPTHFRVARPVTDINRAEKMYTEGLGLVTLGRFADHEGFDGVMVGEPDGSYHFEFVYCRNHPINPTPTPEDLLVFYEPRKPEWLARCRRMEAAGFKAVRSLNPYWESAGRTFEDPDGYRIVLQCATWQSKEEP